MGSDRTFEKHYFSRNVAIVIYTLTLLTMVAWAQPFNDTQPYSKHPKLESVLSQLISADNPQEFAQAHDLYMQNGKVRVVVELTNKNALLPDYVLDETRYENNVQTLVPIEKLAALAEDSNVTFIRAPLKPYKDTPVIPIATAVQTSIPKSGFNTAISFILSIALILLVIKIRSDKHVKK